MKKCLVVVFLMLLIISFSACSAADADEIYAKWNKAFTQWRESNQDDCYGFISTAESEAFIYNYNGELYCGEYVLASKTQELYYRGNVYRFSGDSTTPEISPATDAEITQKYCALKERIAIGIKEKINAQKKNYKEHSTGFLGDILGDAEFPLFCGANDQILIFNLPSDDEFGHMAYQADTLNFVYNMQPSGKTQAHANLLLVGWYDGQLYGWEGYDIR